MELAILASKSSWRGEGALRECAESSPLAGDRHLRPRRGPGQSNQEFLSADVFDDLDEFVGAVAVVAGELDELLRALDDGASFGCA